MFFEKEFLLFNIIDVIELKQQDVNIFNHGRNYSALSFRLHSDAMLKTSKNQFNMCDNCIAYVPSNVEYHRTANMDEMIVIHFEMMNYHTDTIEFFTAKNPDTFIKLFKELLYCWNTKELSYKYNCTAILCEIFAKCHRQNFKLVPNQSKIASSAEYLQKHYTDSNLSIKELAEKSFMSEVYFRKLFKEEFGTSPQKYIINLRIQHAIGLISTGYFSLQEVAARSGYNDYKYFSTEFKKVIGVSPSNYLYNFHKKTEP